MTFARPVAFLTPEEIASRDPGVPADVRAAEATVFDDRARRLEALAVDHPMAPFLSLLALVVRAQHGLLAIAPVVANPSRPADPLDGPPLDALDPASLAGWRDDLRALVITLSDAASTMPKEVRTTLGRLRAASDGWLDAQATQRLAGFERAGGDGLDPAAAPFIAAALQVHWTRAAIAWHAASRDRPLPRVEDGRRCPCCGSRPVASLVRIGGSDSGTRYLHCNLCQTQWHAVRIRCTHCGGTAGIGYHGLASIAGGAGDGVADEAVAEGGAAGGSTPSAAHPNRQRQGGEPVQIETCDSCRHYLKIVHRTRDPDVEPVADDLATLTLDLLASEAGWLRHGDNLLLLLGDPHGTEARPPPDRSQ